ncbi:Methyltransferase type 11 [Arabidopsis suecica]|uniref:Methyltransferase type 11 n=1 Tax=Arabidopsis suecica TaxID=45249 RepID=A0A8T2BXW4_ARASU|nr:Methyltransferase type 11 [Arabidopsis suecica]
MPMTVVSGRFSSAFLPNCFSVSRLVTVKYAAQRRVVLVSRSAQASSVSVSVETNSNVDSVIEKEEKNRGEKKILACPICYNSLAWISQPNGLIESAASGTQVQCNTCKRSYLGNETHLDLAVASGSKRYSEPMPLSTELFRTPLVSFLYERGWRQNFIWGGFPGPDKEFEMAKDYLKPVLGGNIIDASCGSGMFSRLFARSDLFSLVIALDYSENMLRQCYELLNQEENFPNKEKLVLVRADIARLPFLSGSVDAVHAGAALHCWPSPSLAVAEISRVLRPGGVFVATTFIYDGPFSFIPFLKNLRQEFMRYSGSHMFLNERELEDLCKACGLVGFTRVRNGPFIMLSATKPS